MPNLLPEEFLESDEDEDEDMADADDDEEDDAHTSRRKTATVHRQLTRLERPARDERVGSTVYRVAKRTDGRLAPKAKRYAQSGKNVLLRRNRTAVKPRAGFLRR